MILSDMVLNKLFVYWLRWGVKENAFRQEVSFGVVEISQKKIMKFWLRKFC
jgi:hypothetical protein